MVGACAPPPSVEVVERVTISEREETEKIGGALIRIVEPGDTLHSIAFATRQNVNDLAAWNQLSDTDRLVVGQRIRMTKPLGFKPPVRKPIGVASKPTQAAREPIVAIEMEPAESQKPLANQEPSANQKPAPLPNTEPNQQPSATVNTPPGNTAKSWPASINWTWPTNGSVVGRFAIAQGKQGIDIQGKPGQPVFATDAGEVVYVGNGLKGYGNLVIIKHNDTFLSAYAHNRETFVTEGQRVGARFVVGALGQDRQRRNALHFQIRKNGKPVNPLAYLPKR